MSIENEIASEINSAVEEINFKEQPDIVDNSDGFAEEQEEEAVNEGEENNNEEDEVDKGEVDKEKEDDQVDQDEEGDDKASDVVDTDEGEVGESGKGKDNEEESSKEDLKPSVEQPKISNVAIMRAVRAGMDIQDAQQFGSEQSLLRVTESLEGKGKSSEDEKDPFSELPELDPEVYGEEAIKTFDTMKEMLKSQNEQIKLLTEGSVTREDLAVEAATRDLEQWFDGKIGSLGSDFEDILGKGGHAGLDPGSSQYAKREQIAQQVGILMSGYEASGRQAPSRDELFDMAARSVLADDFQKVNESKIRDKLKKRGSSHVSRAGSVNARPTKPLEDELAKKLDEQYFS